MAKQGLDEVFVDGLHTYAQSLKDVQHALRHLNPEGIIVIHDCSPPSSAAAAPTQSVTHAESLRLPGWTKEWCGDVWKTIVHLRAQAANLRVFVLDCDYGLGSWREANQRTR